MKYKMLSLLLLLSLTLVACVDVINQIENIRIEEGHIVFNEEKSAAVYLITINGNTEEILKPSYLLEISGIYEVSVTYKDEEGLEAPKSNTVYLIYEKVSGDTFSKSINYKQEDVTLKFYLAKDYEIRDIAVDKDDIHESDYQIKDNQITFNKAYLDRKMAEEGRSMLAVTFNLYHNTNHLLLTILINK